jgi:peptidoglycan/xylan/chitin deacetylase (PgdA/CDA1 family)
MGKMAMRTCTTIFLLIAGMLAGAWGTAGGECFAATKPEIIVVLRYDDYSSRSATTLEKKIIDALRTHRASCTFGVIPYVCAIDYTDTTPQQVIPLSPAKAAILHDAMQDGTVDVAVHGYTHQTWRNRKLGLTEFAGLDVSNQVEKIASGQALLEGMLGARIATFIPPFNSYDANTVRALETLRFDCLSANRFLKVDRGSQLKFLPITCELFGLRNAITAANSLPDAQQVIGVMFHEYDFSEIDGKRGNVTYQDFVKLLAWLMAQENVRVMSISKAKELIDDLSAHRFADNRGYCRTYSLVAGFIAKPVSVYMSSATARSMAARNSTFTALVYGAVILISCLLAYLTARVSCAKLKTCKSAIYFSASLLILFVLLYHRHLMTPGFKYMTVLSVLLGVVAGICLTYRKIKKSVVSPCQNI